MTTTLNFEAISRASAEHEMIATWMLNAECNPAEVVEALETFDRIGDLDHPDVREAMRVDEWPADLRDEWDGETEQRDTEYRGHIAQAAD